MSLLLSTIPLAYRVLALAALSVTLFGYGFLRGAQHEVTKFDAYKAAQSAAIVAQVVKSAQATASIKSSALALEKAKDEKISAITAQRDRAISELRNRPERRPDMSGDAASCAGASGAELSRSDAAFLIGDYSAAAQFVAERNECIAKYNLVRDKVNALKSMQ